MIGWIGKDRTGKNMTDMGFAQVPLDLKLSPHLGICVRKENRRSKRKGERKLRTKEGKKECRGLMGKSSRGGRIEGARITGFSYFKYAGLKGRWVYGPGYPISDSGGTGDGYRVNMDGRMGWDGMDVMELDRFDG